MPESRKNKTADTEIDEVSGNGKGTGRGKNVLLTIGDFLSTSQKSSNLYCIALSDPAKMAVATNY